MTADSDDAMPPEFGPPGHTASPGASPETAVHDLGGGYGVRSLLAHALDEAVILAVDDEEVNVRILQRLLRDGGYRRVVATTRSPEAVRLLEEHDPDLVLLDLRMPEMDGYQVLERIRARVPEDVFLPVLVLTGDLTSEARQRALALGANDFVSKPFDRVEVLLRIRNLLRTRALHAELQRQNEFLEERVRERTRELRHAEVEILERLARAGEYGDDATGEHTQRVARLATLLARELGLPEDDVSLLGRAALLHDVGKLGLPDDLLRKPGRLNPAEFELVMAHTTIGADILSGSRFPLLRLAEEIALSHHEAWDGSGYPRGLRGEAIPMPGRIVAVADVYDVLTHDRPYRPARSPDDAMAEIRSLAGRRFDPAVVDALHRVRSRLEPPPDVID